MSAEQIVALLTNPENIIIVLGSFGTFLTVIAFTLPFLQRDSLSPRLKAVAARREELRQQATAHQAANRRPGRKEAIMAMSRVLGRLNLMKQLEDRELRMKLARAGWRGHAPVVTFVFGRVLLPLVVALTVAFCVFVLDMFQLAPAMKLVAVMGGAVLGYYVPNVIVKNVTQKRQESIQFSFPDALDLMIICVEAGLSLEAAFNRVADEVAENAGELAEELGLTTAELNFLGDRRQALMNFADRLGMDEAKALATSLIQSEQYGTPLTVALRVLSRENRDARMSRAEQKAGALPAMLTGPMIVFFLPVVFIVLLGPAIIQIVTS
ncbi:MAG: type II secretion system protein [Alphaproteobacteria bacterium]|nr:type II secretion system protein [Alphaproteobacteria bacterium]|tara:strand:- start:5212 stop:6183 length:972 start_codon:yes stop_codon:yes gene_type:complete